MMAHVIFSRYEPPFSKTKPRVNPVGVVGLFHVVSAPRLMGTTPTLPLCSLLGPLEGTGVLTVVLSPENSLSGADSGSGVLLMLAFVGTCVGG